MSGSAQDQARSTKIAEDPIQKMTHKVCINAYRKANMQAFLNCWAKLNQVIGIIGLLLRLREWMCEEFILLTSPLMYNRRAGGWVSPCVRPAPSAGAV
jgi:hypothetical protein